MSDLVRSEVEAALEYANNLLGTHLRRDRIQPALAAARAWLSTPTEPDYEAAAEAMYEADDAYRDTWDSQPEDGVKAWYRQMTRYAVDAALSSRVQEETL